MTEHLALTNNSAFQRTFAEAMAFLANKLELIGSSFRSETINRGLMIISASRRTDIPAFYAEWFMNRIRAGYCVVPNPFNRTQASSIS
jgi:hypothetical protein